jgi:hypothetical protein
MASNARTANKDAVSAFLFTDAASIFFPKPWGTISNFFWDAVGYTSPNNAPSWGSKITFAIPNNVTSYFGKCYFKIETGASVIPAGCTSRYDDFLGYGIWEYGQCVYGSNVIDYLDGEFTKFKFYDEQMPVWKRLAIAPYVHGPKTVAQRQLDLASGVVVMVELPFFFTRGYAAALPLVLGSDLQFQIQLRQFAQVVDSDVGETQVPSVPALRDPILVIQQIYGADNENANLLSHAQTGIMKLIDAQIKTTMIETGTSAAARTNLSILTPQVNLPTSYQNVVMRDYGDISLNYFYKRWQIHGAVGDPVIAWGLGGATNNGCYWNCTSGQLRSPTIGQGILKPMLSSIFRDTPGLLDSSIQMDVAMQPQNASSASGSLNTQYLANFQVVVTTQAPVGAVARQLQFDVLSTCKSVVKAQQGNMYRVFN